MTEPRDTLSASCRAVRAAGAGVSCRHPAGHQRITDVANMDGTIAEERWCTLCGQVFPDARRNRKVNRIYDKARAR